MMEDKAFEKIGKLYREYLKEETRSADLAGEKRRFLKAHFSVEPKMPFYVEWAVPGLAFGLLFALCFLVQEKPISMLSQVPEAARILLEERMPGPAAPAFPGRSSVRVKRVVSRTGPTMIYQRTMEGIPVTVVWVFSPPKGAGAITGGNHL